jgi:hypothetical protein
MRFRRSTRRYVACAALAAACLSSLGAGTSGPAIGFGTPTYVDTSHAGGEPVILNSGTKGTLVYTSHQGTTHLYRDGIVSSPDAFAQFLLADCNQVYVWYSTNGGASWTRVTTFDTSCTSTKTTGFSDPDLTQDQSGLVYDTGINLVNDSIFASPDGGKTWPTGTPNCHDGDRPWLAGGTANQVFMGTDTVENVLSHQVFEGTVDSLGLVTCSLTGVADTDGVTYTGDGKLAYDRHNGNLVEPAIFFDANGKVNGVGVSVAQSWGQPFLPHLAATGTTLFAHWPALAIDAADNYYLVWDTDDRTSGTSGGCGGAENPAPNSVMMAVSSDHGQTWRTTTVAHPGSVRVLWPWVVAGDRGKVSVVWYQLDRLADPDCQPANTFVYDAQIFGADGSTPSISVVNASGRSIHYGTICQGGTNCVATGQDRRLGDFFTNAIDQRGCVVIATGDTMLMDPMTGGPLPTARPLFIRQNIGPTLVGGGQCT